MESSFKKAYDKTVNKDGSIDLRFTAERIGAHTGSGFAGIFVLAMFPVSCAVTSPVAWALYEKGNSYEKPVQTTAMVMWALAAVALWIYGVRKYNFRQGKLTLKPGEGILFGGKQLPFRDIQSVRVVRETTERNPKGNAYVAAQSGGKEIHLTGYVSKELAIALAAEINRARGFA